MAVYVDDILITGSDQAEVNHVKHHLNQCFGIKDLGQLHYFPGFEVSYVPEGIVLSQKKFTLEFLKDSGLTSSKPAATPLPLNSKLQPDEGDLLVDPTYYRAMIGKLNFLTNTHPDLNFTAQTLRQFMQKPRTSHLQALHHTLRYIQSIIGKGILL